jgi:putative peptidoglycan lipid II flippase
MVYSGFTLISRLFGFARDLVLAYYLGASATIAADAYTTAFNFPNLFRRIFAEGAFAAAFVPAYSRALEQDGEEIADKLAGDAMAVLAAATLAITIVAELTMPWLMRIIGYGFMNDPAKFQLAINLTRLTMPYLPCMAIYAHLSGVLNARNRFILSAAAPILLNLWTMIAVFPARSPTEAAYLASAGVIGAGVSQALLLAWGSNRSGAKVHFSWPRLTPQIKALLMLAVPGAIAASATQINILISSSLVTQVPGARMWLSVCERLYLLPQGLVGVAIGVALLPQLSRSIHAGDRAASNRTLDQAIVFSMALTLPCAAALLAIPFFLVDALYTRGLFHTFDSQQTAAALLQYGWGVPAFVVQQLLARAFFAHQDTKTPMLYGLVSVAVNIMLGVTLFKLVGVGGIAAATSAASWLNVFMLGGKLARLDRYKPSAFVVSKLIRCLAASAILGGLLMLVAHWREPLQGLFGHTRVLGVGPKELLVGLAAILAGALYPVLLLATGGLTRAEAREALRRKKGAVQEGPADVL